MNAMGKKYYQKYKTLLYI